MDKIKVRDKIEKGIKTLDKKAVQTQKIKNNVITTKEKIEELSQNENIESINSYGTTKIQNAESIAIRDGIYKGNQIGKKAFKETKENIRKAQDKIKDYKEKKIREKMKSQIKSKDNGKKYIKGIDKNIKNAKLKSKQIKTTNSKNLSRKAIKTTERTLKTGQKVAKETLKNSQIMTKQTKIATQKSGKHAKVITKAVVQDFKGVASATKAIILSVIAGGWTVKMI